MPFQDKYILDNCKYLNDEGWEEGPSTEPGTYWLLLASAYSSHQESSCSPPCCLKGVKDDVGICGLPLTIPLTRNNFFLFQAALNRARIIFFIICLNLTITSTRKQPFLLSAFHKARILLVITSLPLHISSTRNNLLLLYDVFNWARMI